jgi:hypothetical protein
MNIFIFIILFTMLIMYASLVYTTGRISVENGTYLLGIALASKYRKETDVVDILSKYYHQRKYINLAGFITCFVPLAFQDMVSITILYIFIWFALLLYAYIKHLRKSAWQLYELKRKNGWYRSGTEKVYTASNTNDLKMNKPLPLIVQIIPVAVSVVAMVYCLINHSQNESFVSIIFAVCSMMFVVFAILLKRSNDTKYYLNQEMNQKINLIIKNIWTICFALHAYGAMILSVYFALPVKGIHTPSSIIATSILLVMGSMAVLMISYDKVSRCKAEAEHILGQQGMNEVYEDDDIYWLRGEKNPNNTSIMQEKRVGIGWEFNSGKKADVIIIGLIIAFVLGLALFMLRFDLAHIELMEDPTAGSITVSAANMSYSFNSDTIEEVNFLEKTPSMSKQYGYNGSKNNFGRFGVSGYGTCQVYIYLDTDEVVQIKTTDGNVFINGKDRKETQEIYAHLLSYLK